MTGTAVPTSSIRHKLFNVVLGFCLAYVVMILLGFGTGWLAFKINPRILTIWREMTVYRKGLLVLLIDLPWLIPMLILWRRRKFLALGILLYLAYEVVLVATIWVRYTRGEL